MLIKKARQNTAAVPLLLLPLASQLSAETAASYSLVWDELLWTLYKIQMQKAELENLPFVFSIPVIAIAHYGGARRSEWVERWGQELRGVAQAHPQHAEIQLRLAQGAFNAINDYGTAREWDHLERWGHELRGVAQAHPQHAEIQLELAQGAVNAIIVYGTDRNVTRMTSWADSLEEALPQSSVTPDMFGQFLGIGFRASQTHEETTRKLAIIFANYWPGFLVDVEPQQQVPLCLAVIQALPEAEGQQHRQRITRTYELANELQSGNIVDPSNMVNLVSELWDLRMYLPDRGDALIPILQQLQMQDQIDQARNDPWRRGKDL